MTVHLPPFPCEIAKFHRRKASPTPLADEITYALSDHLSSSRTDPHHLPFLLQLHKTSNPLLHHQLQPTHLLAASRFVEKRTSATFFSLSLSIHSESVNSSKQHHFLLHQWISRLKDVLMSILKSELNEQEVGRGDNGWKRVKWVKKNFILFYLVLFFYDFNNFLIEIWYLLTFNRWVDTVPRQLNYFSVTSTWSMVWRV